MFPRIRIVFSLIDRKWHVVRDSQPDMSGKAKCYCGDIPAKNQDGCRDVVGKEQFKEMWADLCPRCQKSVEYIKRIIENPKTVKLQGK